MGLDWEGLGGEGGSPGGDRAGPSREERGGWEGAGPGGEGRAWAGEGFGAGEEPVTSPRRGRSRWGTASYHIGRGMSGLGRATRCGVWDETLPRGAGWVGPARRGQVPTGW